MELPGFSSAIVGLVAVLSAVLAGLTYLAYTRTQNRKILFVFGAFVTHFAKSVIVFIALVWAALAHQTIEAIEAIFDLVMVVLLGIPFALRA